MNDEEIEEVEEIEDKPSFEELKAEMVTFFCLLMIRSGVAALLVYYIYFMSKYQLDFASCLFLFDVWLFVLLAGIHYEQEVKKHAK
ncbi:MAG: hypothetical protein CL489_10250 [Acidobacteria bacterium]|nr:hypothetical protein [Acidobacteriota bacterium]